MATPAPFPADLSPQLATLSEEIPKSGEWIYEIKFDGYRFMARLGSDKPQLLTRRGHDWSDKMPALIDGLAKLKLTSTWLDGEACVLNDAGMPDFNALQNAFDRRRATNIVFFAFDLPFYEGLDLRRVPLRERRQLPQAVLAKHESPQIRFSQDYEGSPGDILKSACDMGLEGVMAKRADAPYQSTRTKAWLKLKCRRRQEFVIGGFTNRAEPGRSIEVGSLLLGVYEEGKLNFAGSVGTGWDSKFATALHAKLVKLEVDTPPFDTVVRNNRFTRRPAGSARWVKPKLVAEVNYAEWTPDGQLRHASFVGLRTDKAATQVVREG